MRMSRFGAAAALLGTLLIAPAQADDERQAAPNWQFRSIDPNGNPCRAVKSGAGVDTQLVRNNKDKMVLIAGRPDWDLPLEPAKLTLAIDDKQAVEMLGHPIGPVVLVEIDDDAQARQLRSATTLKWHFPWGDYSASVAGLGAAYDKLIVCPAR